MIAMRHPFASRASRQTALLAVLLRLSWISPYSVHAQDQSPNGPKTTISGVVVNAITRAPIPRALVSTPDSRYATLTDSSGQFELDLSKEAANSSTSGDLIRLSALDQIRTWINARKPGFLDVGERGSLASPGKEVTIALTPEALIIGRVTFSTPDTTSHVNVQLFSRQVQDGLPRWILRNSTVTNSAGEFRFANLLPGQYRVGTNEAMDNDPGPAMSRNQVYGFPPLYYAGAADFGSATDIEVAAGETVQADLSLVRQPYYSVKIPVNGYSGGGVSVQVSPQGRHGPGYSLGFTDNKIEGLLPNGNYVVEAMSFGENSASGTTSIRVAAGAVDGPALTMVPNSRVVLNVRDEFTQTRGGSAGDSGSFNSGSLGFVRVNQNLQAFLEPADDFRQFSRGSIRPPVNPNDDSLAIENVPPGRYWLRMNSGRGYVAAATIGRTELLHQPFIVSAGSAVSVDITLRDDFVSVEGMVSGLNTDKPATDDQNSQNVWIYFIPSPDGPGQFQQFTVQANENFTFSRIVPATYRVIAFTHSQQNLPFRDPEAMKAYESKGQLVHLVAGQKGNVQLQAIAEE